MFGDCPTGTSTLYRLYNEGRSGAPNHRYTASRTVFDQMRSQGWTPEGSGSNYVFACIPSVATSPTPPPVTQAGAEGLYAGSTSLNQNVWGIVLPEGTFYVLYSSPGTNTVAGVVQGTGSFASGAFGSSNARDFNILPYGNVLGATVSGTYVSGSSIQGTIAESGGTISFSAQYSAASRNPASLAQAAGSYTGSVASSAGYQSATFTLTSSGGFAGNATGCTFTGTASPRSTLNVFDISVRFNGGMCIFGTSTLYGVAVYDTTARQLVGTAPNVSRSDGFLFIGGK